MNAAHLHLLVNHLPLFGTLCAALCLGYALLTRSSPHGLRIAALLLAVSAAGAGVAWGTGEDAKDLVEGFDNTDALAIITHEEQAELGAVALFVTAGLALVALLIDARSGGKHRLVLTALLLLGCGLSFAALAQAGKSGGAIQHREVRPGFDPNAPPAEPTPVEL